MAEKLSAHCHCGAVAFTVELSDGFNTVRRCNCSYCRMRGAGRGLFAAFRNRGGTRRG
ncbi:Gfa-like protein [Klebsiella pneumoniae]|uniref:Gfa-like protein n=1 Tax=Klebsiella pneumoniae TaxID=573 RepID=A0A4P0Y5E5_KLEPN|nr:Gfa-like protein [Klebsiella pneumoniae]